MLSLLILLAGILLGGFLYRWRGGGFEAWFGKVHRFFKLLGVAGFVSLPLLWAGLPWWGIAAAFGAALYAVSLGHGAYMDLAHTRPERAHDRVGDWQEEPDHGWALRALVPDGRLWGSRYLYELVALSWTGFLIVLGPAVALAVAGAWLPAAFYLLAGLCKGPAYAAGWRLNEWRWETFRDPVALGETLFGMALGLAVGVTLVRQLLP